MHFFSTLTLAALALGASASAPALINAEPGAETGLEKRDNPPAPHVRADEHWRSTYVYGITRSR
ncbi:hypothetical protein TI39_contig5887g00002 [Zymoseptoria brevis]|uniref:Uncharacterized protein n=1 Tax=Zymoseptoria brevis TaxID=1047168 RepID=A0A0F4G590_9PEZI|nr:hypothetical protein TI39_contig5887g00002 [Zymoseptoria brevis]